MARFRPAAIPADEGSRCMPSKDWWISAVCPRSTASVAGFAEFLTDDGEFRFGSQPAVHGQAKVAAYATRSSA